MKRIVYNMLWKIKFTIFILVIINLGLIFFSNNPNESEYISWVKYTYESSLYSDLKQSVDDTLKEKYHTGFKTIDNFVDAILPMLVNSSTVDKYFDMLSGVESSTTRENYIFWSVYESDVFGTKIRILGVLGHFYSLY